MGNIDNVFDKVHWLPELPKGSYTDNGASKVIAPDNTEHLLNPPAGMTYMTSRNGHPEPPLVFWQRHPHGVLAALYTKKELDRIEEQEPRFGPILGILLEISRLGGLAVNAIKPLHPEIIDGEFYVTPPPELTAR